MSKICIIGRGIFGSVIGDHLRSLGHDITWVDNQEEGAGSKPAACLMKPSWMSKVPELNKCLELLDGLYGVKDINFKVNGVLNQTVHWVDPRSILKPLFHRGTVDGVSGKTVTMSGGVTHEFDRVIVAAGVWTRRLCPWVPVEPRWGAAFLWPEHEESVIPPFISQWAPYRQIVTFQRGDGLWAGDGSALKTMSTDQVKTMMERCQDKLDIHDAPVALKGQRPYTSGNSGPCWLEFREDGLIVSTGGAKNGTIGAAWAALEIGRKI